MTISFAKFLQDLVNNGVLRITVILMFSVIIINGWTDAPNAIASSIATKALKPRDAVAIGSVFNFFGVFVMTLINASVAQTIYEMVDFKGDSRLALIALCAAMISIVLWSVLAWSYGIPTSESHALIAGISGAAIALQNGFSGIYLHQWLKVIYGLVLSTGLGFLTGYFLVKLTNIIFKSANKIKMNAIFKKTQIVGSATMAFMHGAQDGQKFMGVFMLGIFLSKGMSEITVFQIPIWLMLICSGLMALGTSIGGYRIIKSVGFEMVKLNSHQALSSDIASSSCLLFSSLVGIPVSTTHMKITSLMGAGLAGKKSSVKWKVVKDIVLTWVLTFPGCGLISYLMAKCFMMIA